MVLKLFPDVFPSLKVDRFEGFLNHIKIDGMVNNYLSSVKCNTLENITEDG